MDPVSLAIIAGLMQVGPAVGGAVAAAGPAAAAVAPAAASVGTAATAAATTAPVWIPATAHAALATGATNPVATQGVEAWANDINNQAVIGSVEANNFIAGHANPHLPPEHQIPERTIGY